MFWACVSILWSEIGKSLAVKSPSMPQPHPTSKVLPLGSKVLIKSNKKWLSELNRKPLCSWYRNKSKPFYFDYTITFPSISLGLKKCILVSFSYITTSYS
jgi:hypothetical protein